MRRTRLVQDHCEIVRALERGLRGRRARRFVEDGGHVGVLQRQRALAREVEQVAHDGGAALVSRCTSLKVFSRWRRA